MTQATTAHPTSPRWPWPRWSWLLPPFLIGMGLRLAYLPRQILGGDELHAVRAALERSLPELLFSYDRIDFCQPLSALYHLWVGAGGSLSESVLRAPILLAAALLLLLVPLAIERLVDRGTATVLAWLLALSPMLVLYGRIVRSYMPATLLASLAGFAFFLWWQGTAQRRRWGVAYAFLAAAALYTHLGTAFLVASPFLFVALDLGRRRRAGEPIAERLGASVRLGLLALACVASFLVPSWDSLQTLIATKQGAATTHLAVLFGVVKLQAGSLCGWGAALFWSTALVGWWNLWRRRRALALFSLTLVGGHLLGLALTSPYGIDWTLALNRYVLFLLPHFLLWVAAGLAGWGLAARTQALAATLVVALLTWAGPIPQWLRRPTPFLHHPLYLDFATSAPLPASAVPAFYLDLSGREPGSLLEAPFPDLWVFGTLFPLYQEHHGRDVLVSTLEGALFQDGRTAWERFVPFDVDAILACPARYLVVHPRLLEEEKRCQAAANIPPLFEGFEPSTPPLDERIMLRAEKIWGEPIYRDQWIVVWDLEAARRAQ